VRADVKALMASIEAPIVANQALAALSAIFTWAIKEERLTTNPCRLIDRNDTKKRERVLAACARLHPAAARAAGAKASSPPSGRPSTRRA
jgi:hypothetical protein